MTLHWLRARPEILIASLALAASASGLGNGFVYDDVRIILHNPLVHHAESVGRIWSSPYWPTGLLYRPFTVQILAAEWTIGQGRQVIFHVVSVLLMMLAGVLFWRLARRILPPLPALAAAALFAVHPVHAESVANVVGQAELLATALTLLAVERHLAWREREALGLWPRLALAVLTLLAIFSKETGYVIPALLVAIEIFLVVPGTPWRMRVGAVAPMFILQAGAVIATILVRIIVLGPTPGAGPAVALQNLAPGERIAGMLAVVPEWARLLLWPVHLQAEYGPPGVAVTGPFGPAHGLGALVLVVALALLVRTHHRQPVIAFGIAWVGIALFPVSNVLTTTGVILAERTLFLPSVGAMLAVGGALAAITALLEPAGGALRHATVLLIGAVVLAGTLRSSERQLVWKEQLAFFRRLETDGHSAYRAQLVASNYYLETGRYPEAERAAARAYRLFKGDAEVFEQYGQTLRRQRRCREALPVLADGVERFPDRTVARSRLFECALAVGDTARARQTAEAAVRSGQTEFRASLNRLILKPQPDNSQAASPR